MPLWVLESLGWVRTGLQAKGSMVYVMGPETQIPLWRPGQSRQLSPKKGLGPGENPGWPVVHGAWPEKVGVMKMQEKSPWTQRPPATPGDPSPAAELYEAAGEQRPPGGTETT